MAVGECVEVLTSDKSSVNDFHRLMELTEHTMMVFEEVTTTSQEVSTVNQEEATCYRYVVQKGQ